MAVSDTEQAVNRRRFNHLLVNTFIANVTTSYLWFAVTFWVYLETRSVLATSIIGGAFMLFIAVAGVPFGSWVDRTHKKTVMVSATVFTAVAFALAFVVYLVTPRGVLLTVGSGGVGCSSVQLESTSVAASPAVARRARTQTPMFWWGWAWLAR